MPVLDFSRRFTIRVHKRITKVKTVELITHTFLPKVPTDTLGVCKTKMNPLLLSRDEDYEAEGAVMHANSMQGKVQVLPRILSHVILEQPQKGTPMQNDQQRINQKWTYRFGWKRC